MRKPDGVEAFAGFVDLVSDDLGGRALLCSDDFFAEMTNLTNPEPAVFDPDAYTDRGKLMDGWESRRKRVPGHDWCILQLGVPGRIHGADIDTAHFLGNHGPFASIDACHVPADTSPEALRDQVEWTPILPEVPLRRGSHNLHGIRSDEVWTHVRLNMHPDGGIARLRLYGLPEPTASTEVVDLASLASGGRALACSDMFFAPMYQLLLPKRAEHMGKGWETRRSRPPGEDWIIVQLGHAGLLERFILDTNHFKGNFADRASIEALYWPDAPTSALIGHADWHEIVPSLKLRAHEEIEVHPNHPGPWTHLRMRIWPDGGVSRLRAFGRISTESPTDALVDHLNTLDEAGATEALSRCCGSTRWVKAMVAGRPYTSRTHLFGHAEVTWWRLGDGDWLEAFTHHPKIGADIDKLRERFASTAGWSEGEQSGVASANEETLAALAKGNTDFEARFGHIFIVCASGLTAQTMLDLLQERLPGEPANELRIAAGEQVKITRLRLEKLETP